MSDTNYLRKLARELYDSTDWSGGANGAEAIEEAADELDRLRAASVSRPPAGEETPVMWAVERNDGHLYPGWICRHDAESSAHYHNRAAKANAPHTVVPLYRHPAVGATP